MNKFVVLAFVFFAVVFYEASGGADFDPEAARLAAIETRQARETARLSAGPGIIVTQALAPARAPLAVPRVAESAQAVTGSEPVLNLVSFASVANPRAAAPESPPGSQETTLEDLAATVARQEAPLDLAALAPIEPQSSAPQTPLPRSIVFPGSSVIASSAEVGRAQNIRVVKGALVNMRSGPGTNYDVVEQLPQATRVEVLTDTGNGWVELRPLDGGTSGWIAAFLLADG